MMLCRSAVLILALSIPAAVMPVYAEAPAQAGIASAHPFATRAGHEILAAGGNAFDAAVAVSAVLAVVEPYSSGLGGGGFWLLHRARDGFEVMLDARERAPLAAHRDLYLDPEGNVVPRLSIDGPLAAGIPGIPAALVHLSRRYGRLPLEQSLGPAIRIARTGFQVDAPYRRLATLRHTALRNSPSAARVFLHAGNVPPAGHVIRQPELATTLEGLARHGRAGFYEGEFAARLVAGVRAAGGIWSREDLHRYTVVERVPLRGHYRGMSLVSASPPSSGGVALVTLLNILSGYELETLDEEARTHLVIEAMRRAYRDRAVYLGDPDHVQVPVQRLTGAAHARTLRAGIDPETATASSALPGAAPAAGAGTNTSHFSIVDQAGNRVAATLSINYPFGSGFMPPGTGVLLNDEMDDFSAKPGVPNIYGLIGGDANAIGPGRRPLSSMSPTFLEQDGRVAILGTPGGSRIISMVLLAALEFAHGGTAESMVAQPRYHHQYLPDVVQHEPGAFATELSAGLQLRGHVLAPLERGYGNMQVVIRERDSGRVTAASDPRGRGGAEVRRLPQLVPEVRWGK